MNEVVEKRIRAFKGALQKLREIYESGKDEFLKNWKLQDSALRNFQVAIESLTDIANHIISEKNWDRPTGYKDIIRVLNKKGVIPDEFLDTANKIMGFRNLIVHEYLSLELEKIYDNLTKLDDLEKFLGYLLEEI